jgi:hypothetical protein
MKISRRTALLFATCLLTFQTLTFPQNAHAAADQAPASQSKKKNKTKNRKNRKKLILKGHRNKHSRKPA